MRVASLGTFVLAAAATVLGEDTARAAERTLVVCADPNNLPFSNVEELGFENALAELIAADIGADVRYTWRAQRRGFIRETLDAGHCDVVMGVPDDYELVATTRPYYRSSYVFVHRPGLTPPLTTITDPRLANLSIGVHLIGDDGANTPPVHALGRQGVVDNVIGFMIYGDYRTPNPAGRPVEAVAREELDVAAVWGPIGGFFAQRANPPLEVRPIARAAEAAPYPFEFAIALGVRKNDGALRDELDEVLERRAADIEALLRSYGVPMVAERADSQ